VQLGVVFNQEIQRISILCKQTHTIMAGQTYQVNYIVNVDAAAASNAINAFKQALMSMNKATKPLVDLENRTRSLIQTMGVLTNKPYVVKVDTKPATQKIGKLVRALKLVQQNIQQINSMGISLGGVTANGKGKKGASKNGAAPAGAAAAAPAAAASSRSRASRSRTSTTRAPRKAPQPLRVFPSAANTSNLAYKLWGPTPLTNNGGMAIDMLKGMGIAYGIAGLGTLVSNVADQAVEYDNLMKTVENILKSHDVKENFSGRFNDMGAVIRNVGMETKFTVTEVADAAKFLAMAGFDVDSIKQSIRPIADIALVGDTDLGQTADLVTNIMTAYNIAPSKMRNAADVMTNTFTMSNTTLTEIAEAYKYAASLLSAGDVSFEEATAAIGVLGDAGIKGSQAGTTLRTIMSNIVNPTQKQLKAWNAVGISRFNSDGSRKNILQLFKELNAANLDVSSYYKLFHKTAASGAVSLSSNVDKWENVYLENFMSQGMSAALANEKKNTLQGLWAQLASVFTDKGVTAFGGIQGQLRVLMNQAIDWLKTDKATEAFKKLSSTLMEFIHLIINATKLFAQFFDKFGGIIMAWAKFQLLIWPVVKGVTAFRSVMLALLGVKKVGYLIMGLANSFKTLGTSAAVAGTQVANSIGSVGISTVAPGVTRYSTIPWMPGVMASSAEVLRREASFSLLGRKFKIWRELRPERPHYEQRIADPMLNSIYNHNRAQRYIQDRAPYAKRIALGQIGGMAANVAGSGLMMFGMHQLTKDDRNGLDEAAGALYSAAGVAALTGGAWGIGIAVGAGIAGGLLQAIGSVKKSAKIYGDIQEFAKQHAITNGTIANSENTTMQYLEQQYNKHKDINDLVQKRIELTAKLLGLQTGENPIDASTGVFKDLMDKYDKMRSGEREESLKTIYKDQLKSDLHLEKFNGGWYLTTADKLTAKYVPDGNGGTVYKVTGVNGEEAWRATNGAIGQNKAAYVSAAATAELMSPGGYYEKTIGNLHMNVAKMGYSGASIDEFNSYMNEITHANDPQYLEGLVPLSEIKDTDWNQERMLKDEMTRRFMWGQMQEIIGPMQKAYVDFRKAADSNTLSPEILSGFLRFVIGDEPGSNLKDYNPYNINEWYEHYGFKNGTFTWLDSKDEKTGNITHYNAQEAAQLAASNMQSVIDAVQKLGVATMPAGQQLINYCNLRRTLS
jgi:TP901 family phage tail tape measure protein